MKVRQIVEQLIYKFSLDGYIGLNMSFNFIIDHVKDNEEFHIHLLGTELSILDGLAKNPIGFLNARENTLQYLIQIGLDPLKFMMQFNIPDEADKFDLPEIDSRIHIKSSTIEGEIIQFDIFIEDGILKIIEGNDGMSDIQIKIKGSHLPKLINGKFNLPFDLMTGRIRIKNKSALFQLLSKYGLKF